MRGPRGSIGKIGPTGPTGQKGENGQSGRTGEPGRPGAKGMTVWKLNRFVRQLMRKEYSRSCYKRTPSGSRKNVRNWNWPLTGMYTRPRQLC